MDFLGQARIARSFAKHFIVGQWGEIQKGRRNCKKILPKFPAPKNQKTAKKCKKRPLKKSSKSIGSEGNVKIHGKNRKSLEGVNDFRKYSENVKTLSEPDPKKQKKPKKVFQK